MINTGNLSSMTNADNFTIVGLYPIFRSASLAVANGTRRGKYDEYPLVLINLHVFV